MKNCFVRNMYGLLSIIAKNHSQEYLKSLRGAVPSFLLQGKRFIMGLGFKVSGKTSIAMIGSTNTTVNGCG